MSAWKRYAIAVTFLAWLVGNIPAWVLLPTFTTSSGHQQSWAIWWSLAPVEVLGVVPLLFFLCKGLMEFTRWTVHGDQGTKAEQIESQAERIASLERELGIGD
jgi:hypothetical protein